MSDDIYIDQTLHGYADGHQLLASSIDLTSEQQSTLLIMSDLSGPAFRTGYETYLTGYALAGAGFYCIARTWFAPELPRPGCVWTQTLLIRLDDLARISNFDQVNCLFHRPAAPTGIEDYQRRMVFEQKLSSAPRTPIEGRAALRALYGTDKKVVITTENADTFEALVLAVFEQQWPRLRRNFRFCTGALSLRDAEFDLSISPPEAAHSLSQSGTIISDKSLRSPEKEEEWLEVAYRDLVSRQAGSEYRDFLWRFGPDQVDGRAVLRPLTEIYCLLHEQIEVARGEKLLSALGYFYPAQTSAGRLKAEIFGRNARYSSFVGSEGEILKLLVTHPYASAIPDASANIGSRSADLVVDDPQTANDIALLAGQIGGENADRFLDGFLRQENWSGDFLKNVPLGLLTLILTRHPSLIPQATLWSRPDHMSIVGKFLPQISADSDILRDVLASMVEANAWDAISTLINNCGSRAVTEMFAYLDEAKPEVLNLPDSIYEELADHHGVWSDLIKHGRLGPIALKVLSAELDPRSWYVRRADLNDWSRVLDARVRLSSSFRSLRSAVFILSIGLASHESAAARLVASAFPAVFEAAANDQLDGRLWQELEPNLSWYSPSWDKCARLIRTVARAFKERPWELQFFFLTFNAPDVLAQALREIDDTHGGHRYLRKVRKQASSGAISLSQEQLNILANS